jgi:nitrate reductase gamma subunit
VLFLLVLERLIRIAVQAQAEMVEHLQLVLLLLQVLVVIQAVAVAVAERESLEPPLVVQAVQVLVVLCILMFGMGDSDVFSF